VTAAAPAGSVPTNGQLTWLLGRRRVFAFFAAFTIVALGDVLFGELDKLTHAFDDIVIVILMAVVLGVIGSGLRKTSVLQLSRQQNIVLVIVIVALIIQIVAFPIEMKDPMDFGNEIPVLLLLVAMIVNRFV
jgi:hypothetical protein